MKRSLFVILVIAALSIPSAQAKYSGGSGTAGDPYKIGTAADLLALAADTGDYDYGKCFILTADIDLASSGTFTTAVIAPDIDNTNWDFNGVAFTGIFDGAGHKIANLTINTNGVGNDYLGLFGAISGEIKNLGLENISITGGDDSHILGGLVGYNDGTISNCYSSGTVIGGGESNPLGGLVGGNSGTISSCYSACSVTGGDDSHILGGLAGDNSGSISNCYATGSVHGENNSYDLGGLVGWNDMGTISNCYAIGNVTGGGNSVFFTSELGGLVACNDMGTISSCYFLVTSGPDNGYGTPLTDGQMKQQSSFVGWDFDTVWDITENETYPFLRVFEVVTPPPTIEIIDAKMVSPNELGIGIRIKFPKDAPKGASRKVKFWATITGQFVEKEFDITRLVEPGEIKEIRFDYGSQWVGNPVPPRVINFSKENVPRFEENEKLELYGVAYLEDGPQSSESVKEVKILLPVIILHGYTYTHTATGWLLDMFKYIAYDGLIGSLTENGYTTDDTWYRTLWTPNDFPYLADKETKDSIVSKVDNWVNTALAKTYADKVNLIGHSTGGLVARYYSGTPSGADKVSKVIMVGTPNAGATLFYEVAFDKNSKAEAEKIMKVPPLYTEDNLLWWFVPTYQAVYDSLGQPVPHPFENTFSPIYNSKVKYYSIFSPEKPTLYQLKVEEKDSWYKVIDKTTALGDGTVLTKSAIAPGYNIGIPADKFHQFLCEDPLVKQTVLHILSNEAFQSLSFDGTASTWFAETINPSDTIWQYVSVEPGVIEVDFTLSWPGSNLDLVLHDPNGCEINPEVAAIDPNIDFIEGDTYEQYTVRTPAPGNWIMEIRGIDVPVEGEEYLAIAHLLTNRYPQISVSKCTVAAGSKINSDKISVSGQMGASADDFNDANDSSDANFVKVTISSEDMDPCVQTFPINGKTWKKGKFSYSGKENGVKKSFKYDVKTRKFALSASNVNLSGLGCPLTIGVNIGDYTGTADVNETIVNGPKKPIPIKLLMGVKNSLRVDKWKFTRDKNTGNITKVAIRGGFSMENLNDANMADNPFYTTIGSQTFTIPADSFIANKKGDKFTCSKVVFPDGEIAAATFDFNKCTFVLTIKGTKIMDAAGSADFSIDFAGFSEGAEVFLP